MQKKILLIIIDGLGDRPVRALGNKTPLEAAKKPNLDLMARNGICGLIQPDYKGEFPSSDDGHLSLFGYDIKKLGVGRGIFEALGLGIKLRKNDLAFRGNFATVCEGLRIVDRRAGRIAKTDSLIKSLQGINIKGVKFILVPAINHRLSVVLRGRGLSEAVSDGDTHQIGIKVPSILPLINQKEAFFTADILNQFLAESHNILKHHPINKKRERKGLPPANFILLRGASKWHPMLSFQKKWRMRACCVAGGNVYKGLARALGMDVLSVRGANGLSNTNIKGKFEAAKKALMKYDFVYCHIKAADEFGHDGDCVGKMKIIERIDRYMPVFRKLKNVLVIVTGDHSTPCQEKEHSPDPVPALVFGNGCDAVEKFSEKACGQGKLGLVRGVDFLKKIVKIRGIRA